jgi:Flp pilus assembly pilin Flp
MRPLNRRFTRPSRLDIGQGMVEYALILCLIAMVVVFVPIVLGYQLQNTFIDISKAMGA